MIDKIICKLIKKQVVIFGDILDYMKFYAIIYAETIMIISLTPVIAAIFDPEFFELVALGTPVIFIFVLIPYFFIHSFKYILEIVGLYNNVIEQKVAECPVNIEIIKKEENTAVDIKEKTKLILGIIIGILMIIFVAEMIYFDVPMPIGP